MIKPVNEMAAAGDAAWERIHGHLESEMRSVRNEIRRYPAPIPACDAQFNYLVEKREALVSEISRVRELMSNHAVSDPSKDSLESYLNASTCLTEAAKSEIRVFVENDNNRGEEDR